MYLLIDTSSEKNWLAINDGKNNIQEISWSAYKNQSRDLLPKIDLLLKKNELAPRDLKGIGVFRGPGSFTGLRVGISVANALAWSLNIPVFAIKNRQIINPPKAKHFSKIITPSY
ncbi:MAG: tRNA (adenosine(37)-N6)-threonylcarbamoyltransferase complex dimerization subunit type 1 TsaB [Patescibacteria group bacterium]|nr:tRNA (adenosine(37)-N6)-threonylcarbamoyltransferase complex dimerization subunit type 1 TsaB [Patescibacteria group bacterium]